MRVARVCRAREARALEAGIDLPNGEGHTALIPNPWLSKRWRSRHLPLRPKAINGGLENFPGGRLGEDVIEAHGVALGSVHFVGMARHCDQHFVFQLLVFTKKSCDVNAIHFRHSKVQQNYVREMGFCGFESCDPVISDVGLVTMCSKQTTKRVRRIVRIISDENAGQMCVGTRIPTSIPCIV